MFFLEISKKKRKNKSRLIANAHSLSKHSINYM